MELSTALTADLAELEQAIDGPGSHLGEAVRALAHSATRAVRSLLGLSVTLVVRSQPVELVAMNEGVAPADIVSSLQMALTDPVPEGVHGVITLYAGEPDAFLDLAAELTAPDQVAPPDIHLDTALNPNVVSGVTGFRELHTIDMAIGMLIGQGRDRRNAEDMLLREATTARHSLHDIARDIVEGRRL